MSRELRGYFPIMATAYDKTGEVDLASMRRLTNFLIENGAQGMSPNGGDSEARSLTPEERMRIVEVVVEASGGRTPVLVGTSADTTEESLQLNRQAQQAGADAVFAKPGWAGGLADDEIVAYYDAISEVLDIPIMIHGTHDMDLPLMQTLLARFPRIQYVKEETSHGPKLRRYVKELGERVTIFGPGLHYPGELGWGALGVMPSCAAPHAHARVFDLWQEGRQAEARREWNRMLPLVFWRWHTAAGEAGKAFLVHMGVFSTPLVRQRVALPGQASGTEVRFGARALDDADEEEMLTILETMGGPPY